MQITIGASTTILALPRSATERLELIIAVRNGTLSLRTAAAAIGCCWPRGPGRPAAGYRGDVSDYGRAVADDLLGRGATISTIMQAGGECIEAIVREGVPGLAEASEASGPT